MHHLQVFISAENKEQADTILNSLLKKKLVTGGMFFFAPARFWWKGQIVDMNYCTISTFTTLKHKQSIIDDVKKTSVEHIPFIWFVPMDANKDFLQWIEETVQVDMTTKQLIKRTIPLHSQILHFLKIYKEKLL